MLEEVHQMDLESNSDHMLLPPTTESYHNSRYDNSSHQHPMFHPAVAPILGIPGHLLYYIKKKILF